MMMLWPGIDSSHEVRALRRLRSVRVPVVKEPPVREDQVRPEEPDGKWIPFTVGDTQDIISIAYAMRRGYRIVVDGDGVGEITNPKGRSYYILDFGCDCPDKRGNGGSHGGRCKHEHWLRQMRPCEICGGIMILGEFCTAFGETFRRFECPGCGNTRDFDLVLEERADNKASGAPCQRVSPDERCRQAVTWFRTWRNPRCIWSLLEHTPQIAPALLDRLLEEGEGDLADAVATKHALASEVA